MVLRSSSSINGKSPVCRRDLRRVLRLPLLRLISFDDTHMRIRVCLSKSGSKIGRTSHGHQHPCVVHCNELHQRLQSSKTRVRKPVAQAVRCVPRHTRRAPRKNRLTNPRHGVPMIEFCRHNPHNGWFLMVTHVPGSGTSEDVATSAISCRWQRASTAT